MTAARLVCVLSPAKTLDFQAPFTRSCSQPALLTEAHELVDQLRALSRAQVKKLLGVSDALAALNFDRFQAFDASAGASTASEPGKTLKQAALAFHGPAYQALDASSLSESELQYAQQHVRILCGLYGVLRPLDLIQPYRLEMGQRFGNSRGKDLYEFWGDTLVQQLAALFAAGEAEAKNGSKKQQRVLVNVASQEYFRSLPRKALEAEGISVVDCVFKDDGRIKSVYAKRARGLMCRYVVQQRVESLDDLRGFDLDGYAYSDRASNDHTLVFTRSAAAATANAKATPKTKAKTPKFTPKRTTSPGPEVTGSETEEVLQEPSSALRRSSRKKRKTTR